VSVHTERRSPAHFIETDMRPNINAENAPADHLWMGEHALNGMEITATTTARTLDNGQPRAANRYHLARTIQRKVDSYRPGISQCSGASVE